MLVNYVLKVSGFVQQTPVKRFTNNVNIKLFMFMNRLPSLADVIFDLIEIVGDKIKWGIRFLYNTNMLRNEHVPKGSLIYNFACYVRYKMIF